MSPTPRTVNLQFADLPKKELEKVRDNVSAVVLQDEHLWLGGDEGTVIHRMTRDASGSFSGHERFELKDLLDLPGPGKEEIDIEGLDFDGGYLWLVGSHSAKRKKADDEKSAAENVERLATVEVEGNRFTLARVPIDANGEPVASHAGLSAARLEGDTQGNQLTDALKKDDHVGRFVPRVDSSSDGKTRVKGIPSKDNGFDIEGLAVSGNRVFVGMRGPVLRGWAIVLELRVESSGGVLGLERIGPSGERYIKHFLQLGGLGVRDLVIHGDDLVVLAGPSMDLDGPVFIYRWKHALHADANSLTWNEDLDAGKVAVPFGVTKDHAEGIAIVKEAPLSVLVCYDSPHPKTRVDKDDPRIVKADILPVPAPSAEPA
jgi:hypothetical protein